MSSYIEKCMKFYEKCYKLGYTSITLNKRFYLNALLMKEWILYSSYCGMCV